ncbi:hypothetical protein [Shinella zoogloeoides]|uniref:hypothetical protein n=1 Tax=Shinella zoogloeoides TaxID=352475 RepID=UPI00299D4F25|nr:hypothetical protein [Shinella zoogloeoides]WPE19862.1 hypothetical protein ShzoTeo12_10380 [Shinella zoogloeoides]
MHELYGKPPCDLGRIELEPREMMFWLYCPIKVPTAPMGKLELHYPANLAQFEPIVDRAVRSLAGDLAPYYIYLTAKTLWVTADNPGNRPGWHSDGFLTDDLNFIWSNCNGTLFWVPEQRAAFTQDHHDSLAEMEAAAEQDVAHHRVYPDKHLLLLDQYVIHRVADVKQPGMRTFVKVSFSRHKYNLVGNSINHALPLPADYVERTAERNHPIGSAN